MDRSVKITLAALVFVAGISLALVYRRISPGRFDLLSGNGGQLVLHGPRWAPPPQAKAESGHPPAAKYREPASARAARPSHPSNQAPAAEKSTVLTPIDTGVPPPRLARVFPRNEDTLDSPWRYALGLSHETSDPDHAHSPKTHKIVDGDTLEELALRYFGDSSRCLEIYEANRHILLNPHILPIGVELLIPGGDKPLRHDDGLLPDKPLVPVAPPQK